MRVHLLAVTPFLALTVALSGCGDRNQDPNRHAKEMETAIGGMVRPKAEPAPPAQVAGVATEQAGQPAAGSDDTSLTASDEKLATGQFYDAYPLDMQAGHGVELKVNSRGFKPVVILLDPAQQPLTESTAVTPNPDGSWTLDVRETFPEGGRYFVIITAEQVGATGSYTTEVSTTSTRPIG